MSSTAFDITTRLADLVEAAAKDGPQVLARDGVETAVLISIEDWKQIKAGGFWKPPQDTSRRSLKEILLDPGGPRFENMAPPRGQLRGRPVIEFE